MADKRPLPRPEGLPRISPGGDQPERDAVRMPRAEPPARTRTMPGIPTVALAPPPLPLEVAPTRPAPSPWVKTVMRPTPPSSRAVAVRSDHPPPIDQIQPKPAPQRQPEAATWPPAVTPARSPSPAPTSSQSPEAKLERTVGQLVMLVGRRFGWPVAAGVLGLIGALKPAADPSRADAVASELAALKRERALDRELQDGMLKRESQRDRCIACLRSQQLDIGRQTLPAPDRMGAAQLPRPFVDQCDKLCP